MYKLFIFKNIDSTSALDKVLKKYHIESDIFYNEYGKPYLKNSKYYFNISNCDNITIIGLSNKEIGIDIEKLTYNDHVIKRCFTLNEIKKLKNKKDFTKMWVKKESYVKRDGMGISYGLKNVDTTILNCFKIKKYKNYYISVCI